MTPAPAGPLAHGEGRPGRMDEDAGTMKAMRAGILGIATVLGVTGWLAFRGRHPDAAPHPTDAAPHPTDAERHSGGLERLLADALGERFAFVGATFYADHSRLWLAEIRARRSGDFVLHCTYDEPSQGVAVTDSYSLTVASAGTPREISFVGPSSHGLLVRPLAVIGDTLIVPIPMPRDAIHHRFSLRGIGMAPEEPSRSRGLQGGWPPPLDRRPGDHEPAEMVRYEGDHLIAVEVGVSWGLTTLANGPRRFEAGGVFEATAPGAFRLEIAPEGRPSMPDSRPLEIEIVPREAPIAIAILEWESKERSIDAARPFTFSGHRERQALGVIRLRVGDRIGLRLARWSVPDKSPPPPPPMVSVRELPLEGPADDRRPPILAP